MITTPGTEITWGELHVGSRSIFAAAGFTEVSRPSKRRVVMRIEFECDDGAAFGVTVPGRRTFDPAPAKGKGHRRGKSYRCRGP